MGVCKEKMTGTVLSLLILAVSITILGTLFAVFQVEASTKVTDVARV